MTAPAPALTLPSAPVAPALPGARSAANPAADGGETADFAALLAHQVPAAARPAAPALAMIRPFPAEAASGNGEAAPGKDLPVERQAPAAQVAATGAAHAAAAQAFLSAAQAMNVAAQVFQAAAKVDAPGEPVEQEAEALQLAQAPQPFAMMALLQPPQTAPTTSGTSDSGRPHAAPRAADAPGPVAAPVQQAGKQLALQSGAAAPSALALSGLLLEAAPAPAQPAAAGPEGQPETQTVTQAAARAQPQTLAALAGNPGGASGDTATRSARPAPGSEPETARPAVRTVLPDTAAAIALAQGAAVPAPLQAASAEPTPAQGTGPAQPLSFDQLVDSIARARDGADQGSAVSVAMRHAEFGRISLSIASDGAGLTVAMASADPAFAPAVAAAHAAATSAEPARASAAETRPDAQGGARPDTQAQSGAGGGQQRQQPQGSAAPRPASNPAGSPAAQSDARSGIFA